jgi:hypothetical protein
MLTVALLSLAVLGSYPAPQKCPAGAKARDRAQLEQRLKEAFPSAGVSGLQCECYGHEEPCLERQWRFNSFFLDVPGSKVRFRLRPLANVNMHGKRGLHLRPFTDQTHVETVARALRQHPVVAAAFPDVPLECDAGTNSPGRSTWFFCGPTKTDVYELPLSEPIGRDGFSVGFLLEPDKAPGEPRLVAWSFPADRVPEAAPGWKAARETRVVKALLQKNPHALVDYYRWHNFRIIARPQAGSRKGVVVKFKTQNVWNATEPGPVSATHSDLDEQFSQ